MIEPWKLRPAPDTRWPLRDCVNRLGRIHGARQWAGRQARYWAMRLWFRWYSRRLLLQGDDGRASWHAGRVTQNTRRAWYEGHP